MGLDIYHVKAVSEPVDPHDYIYWDRFLEYVAPGSGFEQYLRDDIPDSETIHVIRLISDQHDFERQRKVAEASVDATWTERYLFGDLESCKVAISGIAVKKGLRTDGDYCDGYIDYPDGTYRGGDDHFVGWWRRTRRKGFYYIDAGYQRKAMIDRFREDYDCGGLYVHRSRFSGLLDYVEDGWEDWVVENLRKNFIENYEERRSVLRIMF